MVVSLALLFAVLLSLAAVLTLATLVNEAAALAAMLTVTVIAG